MAHGMTRREFATAAVAASFAAVGVGVRANASETKTLRFIAQADLRVLDPIWTTAYITRNHGYMVFDTLFALDSKLKPHPQTISDGLCRKEAGAGGYGSTTIRLTPNLGLIRLIVPLHSDVRARNTRRGARVDSSRACVACPCA